MVAVGVLFRTVLHNFYERSYFPAPGWESRWITVGDRLRFVGVVAVRISAAQEERGECRDRTYCACCRVLVAASRAVFVFHRDWPADRAAGD